MIEAIPGKGQNRAKVVCDGCGHTDLVVCDYDRRASGDWRPREGQIRQKLQGKGWALIRSQIYCPECSKTRSLKEDTKMTKAKVSAPPDAPPDVTATSLRQPTREQKREIMSMLDVAYDTKAGRYKGNDTDKTVADAIGGGVLPGWVSAIREEFFGPEGGNDCMAEFEADLAEARKWAKGTVDVYQDVSQRLAVLDKAMKEANFGYLVTNDLDAIKDDAKDALSNLDRLAARFEAIKAAVGPKAGRA